MDTTSDAPEEHLVGSSSEDPSLHDKSNGIGDDDDDDEAMDDDDYHTNDGGDNGVHFHISKGGIPKVDGALPTPTTSLPPLAIVTLHPASTKRAPKVKQLPVVLGRTNLASWWWDSCPCHNYCRLHCRPVAQNISCLSKVMMQIDSMGKVHVVGKNPHLVTFIPERQDNILQANDIITIGRPGREPWLRLQVIRWSVDHHPVLFNGGENTTQGSKWKSVGTMANNYSTDSRVVPTTNIDKSTAADREVKLSTTQKSAIHPAPWLVTVSRKKRKTVGRESGSSKSTGQQQQQQMQGNSTKRLQQSRAPMSSIFVPSKSTTDKRKSSRQVTNGELLAGKSPTSSGGASKHRKRSAPNTTTAKNDSPASSLLLVQDCQKSAALLQGMQRKVPPAGGKVDPQKRKSLLFPTPKSHHNYHVNSSGRQQPHSERKRPSPSSTSHGPPTQNTQLRILSQNFAAALLATVAPTKPFLEDHDDESIPAFKPVAPTASPRMISILSTAKEPQQEVVASSPATASPSHNTNGTHTAQLNSQNYTSVQQRATGEEDGTNTPAEPTTATAFTIDGGLPKRNKWALSSSEDVAQESEHHNQPDEPLYPSQSKNSQYTSHSSMTNDKAESQLKVFLCQDPSVLSLPQCASSYPSTADLDSGQKDPVALESVSKSYEIDLNHEIVKDTIAITTSHHDDNDNVENQAAASDDSPPSLDPIMDLEPWQEVIAQEEREGAAGSVRHALASLIVAKNSERLHDGNQNNNRGLLWLSPLLADGFEIANKTKRS